MGKARKKLKNHIWDVWAKALGEKASCRKRTADAVAIARTLIFVSYLITNLFIIAGVMRQWDRQTEFTSCSYITK